MKVAKQAVRSLFRSFGLNISKIPKDPVTAPFVAPSPLVHHNVDLLLDVGANVGQYAMGARRSGFRGKIVSFEPLPEAHRALTDNAAPDPDWTIHSRCAVGAKQGTAEINISKNSFSSSLLPLMQACQNAAPEAAYIGKAATEVITLDSVFDSYRRNNEKTFLKIDTQGFEAEVLEGVAHNLRNIFAVQIELSTVPLYDSQYLYQHFFTFFEKHGFDLWRLEQGFTDRQTGQTLQFDAVFVRG